MAWHPLDCLCHCLYLGASASCCRTCDRSRSTWTPFCYWQEWSIFLLFFGLQDLVPHAGSFSICWLQFLPIHGLASKPPFLGNPHLCGDEKGLTRNSQTKLFDSPPGVKIQIELRHLKNSRIIRTSHIRIFIMHEIDSFSPH